MSSKSSYSVQIACTNFLSCLKGHFLTACYCSFQREDSSHPTSIVSVGYHVTICHKKQPILMGYLMLKFYAFVKVSLICLMAYQFLMGDFMPKFDLLVNV